MVKKVVNSVVRNAVAEVLLENRDYTAKELKEHVEKALRKNGYKYKFTERTYLKLKTELSPKMGNKEIDTLWTIGACVKANIPPESIPWLLSEQSYAFKRKTETMDKIKKELPPNFSDAERYIEYFGQRELVTIRQAQWYVKLFPTLDEMAHKDYPERDHPRHTAIIYWARVYAYRERVAETLGMEYPDTSDIDAHIINGDIGSKEVINKVLTGDYPEIIKRLKQKESAK